MYEMFFNVQDGVSRAENVSNILFISLTVHHKNVQSNFPDWHIMINPYCWHSNVKKYSRSKFIHSQDDINIYLYIHI